MTAEQTLKQAVSFAKQKKTKEAQQLLRNFLNNHPQEDRAWYLLALLSENKHERISLLKQALRVNPDNQMAQQKLDALTTLTISTPHAEQPQNPDPVEPEPVILENLAEQAHTETPQPALQRQEKPIKPTAKPNLKFGWISLTVILGIALAFGVFTIIQNETLAAAIQSVGASSFSNSEPTVTSILPTQPAAATFAAAIT